MLKSHRYHDWYYGNATLLFAKSRGECERRYIMRTETGFDALMTFVCVDLGYCGCVKNEQAFDVTLLIPECGIVTADQFADWVFLADNQNPNVDRNGWLNQKKAIRDAFVKHMGSEIVDASRLQFTRDPKYASAIAESVECQTEFCRTNPGLYIRKLMTLKRGVFYPADRVTKSGQVEFPQIEVCWLEHDVSWLKHEKEPIEFVKIAFHHVSFSHLSSRVLNCAGLTG